MCSRDLLFLIEWHKNIYVQKICLENPGRGLQPPFGGRATKKNLRRTRVKKRPKDIPVIVKVVIFSAVATTEVFFSEVSITIVIFCAVVATVDDEAVMSLVDAAAAEVFSIVVGMKAVFLAVVATAVVVFSAVVGTAVSVSV